MEGIQILKIKFVFNVINLVKHARGLPHLIAALVISSKIENLILVRVSAPKIIDNPTLVQFVKKLMKNYVTMDIHWLLANAQISVVMVSSSIYNVMMGI